MSDLVARLRVTRPSRLTWQRMVRERQEAAVEIERLRDWVFCPEHGSLCGAAGCCCVDKHQPELAGWTRTVDGCPIVRASSPI